jgi:hypothetical protein
MAPMMSFGKKESEEEESHDWSWDKRGKKKPRIENGIQTLFFGLGFLFVSIAIGLFMPGGRYWWFWMLIPSFMFLGSGIAEIMRAKTLQQRLQTPAAKTIDSTRPGEPTTTALPNFESTHHAYQPPPRQTSEVTPMPPASVTEGTTRLLDREGE